MTSSQRHSPREIGRRGFLGTLGAALAALSAEGCRRAVAKIVPYDATPEQVIPGVAAHYTTVHAHRLDAIGLVVETHEGRPTKVEGNPLHPSSLGAADLLAQASVLDLYDPDRARQPAQLGAPAGWDAFYAALSNALAEHAKDGGAGLRFLVRPSSSPTIDRLLDAVVARFPKSRVHVYAPVDDDAIVEGAKIAWNAPVRALPLYDRADVVLALDSDFLQSETGSIRAQKLFAAGRKLQSANDPMNRLYVVEPIPTTTGAHADHRLRLPRSRVERYAIALAAELSRQGVSFGELDAFLSTATNDSGAPAKWLEVVARDLVAHRGRCLVVAGSAQPAPVHALVHAINDALGNVGTTVRLLDAAPPAHALGDLRALAADIDAGAVATLVIVGGNPAYDAPADLAFAEKIAKVRFTVHASMALDETAVLCSWSVPLTHAFESWGDARAFDGTIAVRQPLVEPLFDGRSDVELLAFVAGLDAKPHDLVRETLAEPLLDARGLRACGPVAAGKMPCSDASGAATTVSVLAIDHDWRKSLYDGVLPSSGWRASAAKLRAAAIAAAFAGRTTSPEPTASSLEIVFAPDAKMHDGAHANNAWLLELPDPLTRIVWDNAAWVSQGTAKSLNVESGDVVTLSRNGRALSLPVFVEPGVADGCIGLSLGWGRTRAGRLGNGRGFDVYPLRTTDAMAFASGVTMARTGKRHELVRAQRQDSTDGRPVVREATYDDYRSRPRFAELESPPKRSLPLWKDQDYSKGHQWGMSIDLNACTGCNACVVACQAENSVPVVGKEQVALGREMHWLRVDRYQEVQADGEPHVGFQPLACVQCEEAPCENVCPVGATMHSAEGLSEVVYNRCIGTRYCANNCPYKVRRFNYFDWHDHGVWSVYGGFPELLQMQRNPNVTVRTRGIIEKCSYCVQRIQEKRLAATREGRDLRDGEVLSACQQTCPSDAIVFGDLNDPASKAFAATTSDRRYGLLEELGTKPRTTYLAKIRNPNREMEG